MLPLKRLTRRILGLHPVAGSLRSLSKGVATIFMLHRFADRDLGNPGHDPGDLRELLRFLRRQGYRLLSLQDLLSAVEQKEPLARAVAFTVDDGYLDFQSAGAAVFTHFDCPVTVFLTTGFVDGNDWLWWDRIEYLIENTELREVELDLPRGLRSLRWAGPDQRAAVTRAVVTEVKRLPTARGLRLIDRLAARLEVDVPERPPERYSALTWDQVRSLERQGVSFGPHTVTHPILSRAPDEQARWEIRESWRRVQDALAAPVPVFCYPNGTPDSFSVREQRVLKASGIAAAVTAVSGYLRSSHFAPDSPGARYALPRFPLGGHYRRHLGIVAGIERWRRFDDDGFQRRVASWWPASSGQAVI